MLITILFNAYIMLNRWFHRGQKSRATEEAFTGVQDKVLTGVCKKRAWAVLCSVPSERADICANCEVLFFLLSKCDWHVPYPLPPPSWLFSLFAPSLWSSLVTQSLMKMQPGNCLQRFLLMLQTHSAASRWLASKKVHKPTPPFAMRITSSLKRACLHLCILEPFLITASIIFPRLSETHT